ncbi:BC_2427 family protein [Bacillus cereus]|uniref:BC_2427 family protein n=1 Tax=Bacillus cereus TaxID=1396 RepID=UPI003D06E4BC
MKKPWIGIDMGHKIYKVEKLDTQENYSQKVKIGGNLVPKLEKGGLIRSMTVKIPFFIISEITNFSTSPNISDKNQEVYVFQNEKNKKSCELDAKLTATVNNYYEEVYCSLVSSNLYDQRMLLEFSSQQNKDNIEEEWIEKSLWIPIHKIQSKKEIKEGIHNYIVAKLPIEIGRYKGEISLREKVVFKEKVIGIREISQDLILTKNEIVFSNKIRTGHNIVTVKKGNLHVEGYISQRIEYIVEQSASHNNMYQLIQNIVLELIIQVIQEQDVRVRII